MNSLPSQWEFLMQDVKHGVGSQWSIFKLCLCLSCLNHRLLCSSVVLKAILSCLSLIVAGVPDKTKTKEFQVECVTYWKLNSVPHNVPDEPAVLLFYCTSRSLTTDHFLFYSLQWFICKGRRQPSKWEKVGLLSPLTCSRATVFDTKR